MKKIVIIPLDERPCNYHFNQYMTEGMPYELVAPPMEYMGNKKIPGDTAKIIDWLVKESVDADGIVVALDTILYGGIVPSRLHHDTKETLLERLNVLRDIKKNNQNIVIYGYQLLMRNPSYSNAEEEPDYYGLVGREIHLYGIYEHKEQLGIITELEKKHFEEIKKILPKEYLDDYVGRRNINSEINDDFLQLVIDEVIDFAIIPQDDSSPYGFTALDQIKTRKLIEDKNLEFKVYMYPGADEVTNVLLSRLVLNFEDKKPLVYLKYSTVGNGKIIPLYEDRYLGETIKYQVLAAGGLIVSDLKDADLVLLVNTPPSGMREASNIDKRTIEYDAQRTLIEFVLFAEYAINVLKKPVIIGDVAYANGGDLHLFKLMKQKDLLYKVAAYAGWNTSSNTLGTAIPQGIFAWLYPNRKENIDFLALRYTEDLGYCSIVRKQIAANLKEPNHYYLLDGKKGSVVGEIGNLLTKFINENLVTAQVKPYIKNIYSPWNRMFEIGLEVRNDNKK
ncbi:DUF4127 family protein [Haploplasma modicum]|uniref:DUF4127 family protein n=1 Tax=Haploplasma modicum TaxID=2150 RepID=UPI00047C2FEB|nr:DUF4127 family protein [Haploplasma modicum]